MSWVCPYGLCDGDGLVVDDATNTAHDCRCRPQMIARRTAKKLSLWVPSKYKNVSFDRPPVTDIEPRAVVSAVRSFVDRLDEHLDAGRGLWLSGPVGTGKTSLAYVVSLAAMRAGRSVVPYSLPALLRAIRHNIGSEQSQLELSRELVMADLLHLDDVGAERTTDWALEELYSIVNARYEEQKSMVITTNLDYDELCAQISERTASRLAEMCGEQLVLTGVDRRIEFVARP